MKADEICYETSEDIHYKKLKTARVSKKKGGGWILQFPHWVGEHLGFNMDSREGKVDIMWVYDERYPDRITLRRALPVEVWKAIGDTDDGEINLEAYEFYLNGGKLTEEDKEIYTQWLEAQRELDNAPQVRPRQVRGFSKKEEQAFLDAPDTFTRKDLLDKGINIGTGDRMIKKAVKFGRVVQIDEVQPVGGGRPYFVYQKVGTEVVEEPLPPLVSAADLVKPRQET